jgi:hypothetical protein
MKPSEKSGGITNFLESLYGRNSAIEGGMCVSPPVGCGKPATEFTDALSRKEYRISGLCQECQDKYFGYMGE